MRLVGQLPAGRPAEALLAVLSARGLEAAVRDDGLWLLDEEGLAEAGAELERFRQQPDDPGWRAALIAARSRGEAELRAAREDLRRRSRLAWRRERRLRRAFQGAASSRPLTLSLLAAGALSAWAGPHEASILLPLIAGLFWLHELGTHVEALRGSRRFALLVVSLLAASQLSLAVLDLGFAGLSGVGFGLLGFTAARARLDPASGMSLPRGLLPLMSLWLVACAAGAAPASVFLAQCTGLVTGLFVGTLPPALARGFGRVTGGTARGVSHPRAGRSH